jgi:hypothetical protein
MITYGHVAYILYGTCIVILAFSHITMACHDGIGTLDLDRYEFAAHLRNIVTGMDENAVLSLLGSPDLTDVRNNRDSQHWIFQRPSKALCYGVDTKCGLPTLGQVCLDSAGKVICVHGDEPPAPVLRGIGEKEVQELLRLIDDLPELQANHYRPGDVIAVANALQPLGKEKALALIDEYLRVLPCDEIPQRQKVVSVLRVLFDVPVKPPAMLPLHFGRAEPAVPDDPSALPRFPLVLLDDIPLFVITGYSLVGEAEDVEIHVRFLRKHGRFRSSLLRPTPRPLLVADRLESEVLSRLVQANRMKVRGRPEANLRLLLMKQLLSLFSEYKSKPSADVETNWLNAQRKYAQHDVQWDQIRNEYRLSEHESDAEKLPCGN